MSEVTRGRVDNENNSQSQYLNILNIVQGGGLLGVSALHYSTRSTEGSEGFGHWLQLMHCA